MKILAENKCFGGQQLQYQHWSESNSCHMQFSLYLPPGYCPSSDSSKRVPVLFWLSGMTCTDQNFVLKSGAQRYAAENRIALVCPDTSPRGEHVPSDPSTLADPNVVENLIRNRYCQQLIDAMSCIFNPKKLHVRQSLPFSVCV